MGDPSYVAQPPRARRPRAGRIVLAGLAVTAVAVAALVATGVVPIWQSTPAGSFQITGVVVEFTGSGAWALCPEANGSSPTCGSAAIACTPASLCNETLRTGDTVPVADGLSFTAMLSNTFDCNYTYSLSRVDGSGAFSVTVAQANGVALPVNIGFNGSGNQCVTMATFSVGFAVGDQGPTDQNLFLTVGVAQELR